MLTDGCWKALRFSKLRVKIRLKTLNLMALPPGRPPQKGEEQKTLTLKYFASAPDILLPPIFTHYKAIESGQFSEGRQTNCRNRGL